MVKKATRETGGRWLVPGENQWEIREGEGDFALLQNVSGNGEPPPPGIALVALPPHLVTCQLFWLESDDEKVIPDLLAMQCERRLLRRAGEVWQHHLIRREGGRLLVAALILENDLPSGLLVEGEGVRFEALPRVLEFPPRSLCLWRCLGRLAVALTDEHGALLYFQALPHQSITPACRLDLQALLWMATAQNWCAEPERLLLFGEWAWEELPLLETLGPRVERGLPLRYAPPSVPLDLLPRSVAERRQWRQRQRRTRLALASVAALYLLFLLYTISTALAHRFANHRMQAQLDTLLPEMTEHQTTARRLDALNPALDPGTYPLELLHRIMTLLPEGGVRLTRFEIVGNRLELGGESSTAREAFDFLNALQSAPSLHHITWEEPPQPVPLPNDTARFTLQGSITGAYEEPDES